MIYTYMYSVHGYLFWLWGFDILHCVTSFNSFANINTPLFIPPSLFLWYFILQVLEWHWYTHCKSSFINMAYSIIKRAGTICVDKNSTCKNTSLSVLTYPLPAYLFLLLIHRTWPMKKTSLFWGIQGMKSYPVMWGLFHKPLQGSILDNQYIVLSKAFFCLAQPLFFSAFSGKMLACFVSVGGLRRFRIRKMMSNESRRSHKILKQATGLFFRCEQKIQKMKGINRWKKRHTPPKFNSSPRKNGGTGRRSGFLLGKVTFQGIYCFFFFFFGR